jgi:hypothetical protein
MQKLSVLVIASLFLFSCNPGTTGNEVQPTDYKNSDTHTFIPPVINPVAVKTDTALKPEPADPAVTKVNPVTATTVTSPGKAKVNPAVVLNNTTAKTAKGLNPAHGLPNHRCDIPVGAPLSTPITKSGVQQQPVQTVTTQASPVVTPPGMNPPHGQPGHDCSVEVGKPLKKAQ